MTPGQHLHKMATISRINGTHREVEAPPLWRRWELPTWLLAATIYGGWLAITWFYDSLPWWAVLPLGAWLCAWHGSLQHEALHGHPTRNSVINEILVFPSLWLWYPYRTYRRTHLTHHRDYRLTCPIDDPESNYVTPEQWQAMGPVGRALRWALRTLAGRLLLGPIVGAVRLYDEEIRRLLRGDTSHLMDWLLHAVSCALVLTWVIVVCGIPFWAYIVLFAYPGISLALLRSFAEHRPAASFAERSVINEAEWPFALLFLNNNLHAVHHREPGCPWYDIPARFRATREEVLADNGGFVQAGYRELARHCLVRPKDAPVHPLFNTEHCRPASLT
jgi:fatty acid desaturase